MRFTYVIHIIAGSLALLSGYTALYSAKGALTHRRSGIVFVCAMLVMATAGTAMAAINNSAPVINIPAGLITSYLVITSLVTVHPLPGWSRRMDVGLMLVAFSIGAVNVIFAFQAFSSPTGTRNGVPAFPFILFGSVGLVGSALDLKMLRRGLGRGVPRLTRHLWRMTFALLIAALSFFIGQAKVFPQSIRIYPLLALPVLAVLLTLLYWLWRVRGRRLGSMRIAHN